jgi:hypothetical protein
MKGIAYLLGAVIALNGALVHMVQCPPRSLRIGAFCYNCITPHLARCV